MLERELTWLASALRCLDSDSCTVEFALAQTANAQCVATARLSSTSALRGRGGSPGEAVASLHEVVSKALRERANALSVRVQAIEALLRSEQ